MHCPTLKCLDMKQICKYKKGADIQRVQEPSIGSDLKGMIRNGIVRNTATECFYNEQKETSQVGSRIRDLFDVVEASGALDSMKKASEKPDEE